MGESVMELGDREMEKIGLYVQSHLDEWNKNTIINFQSKRDIELLERTVRVEEGLKNSIELMRQGFEQVDKRFEQVDKRFEDMQHYMDKRFDEVNKRFNASQWFIGIGFTVIATLIGVFNYI